LRRSRLLRTLELTRSILGAHGTPVRLLLSVHAGFLQRAKLRDSSPNLSARFAACRSRAQNPCHAPPVTACVHSCIRVLLRSSGNIDDQVLLVFSQIIFASNDSQLSRKLTICYHRVKNLRDVRDEEGEWINSTIHAESEKERPRTSREQLIELSLLRLSCRSLSAIRGPVNTAH